MGAREEKLRLPKIIKAKIFAGQLFVLVTCIGVFETSMSFFLAVLACSSFLLVLKTNCSRNDLLHHLEYFALDGLFLSAHGTKV